MTVITKDTTPSTWKARASIPSKRKTRYSSTTDKLEVVSELPAFTADLDVTINWNQLLHMLAEKAARSAGKKAKMMRGAITVKFKGEAK
jgi:hypothetical protein